jgi:hypothetical protein
MGRISTSRGLPEQPVDGAAGDTELLSNGRRTHRCSQSFNLGGVITKSILRLDKSASIASSSAVLRAKRSGLVTISTSPSRRKARHSASRARWATLETCSVNSFVAPAAFRSRSCAARPAA